mmetsp:Transcript_47606/g.136136  ORF Transcript_47606/g.136136 Transcript_47606/m.136136 type:complete len:247 (-) Transcript_47606:674-1414(-)
MGQSCCTRSAEGTCLELQQRQPAAQETGAPVGHSHTRHPPQGKRPAGISTEMSSAEMLSGGSMLPSRASSAAPTPGDAGRARGPHPGAPPWYPVVPCRQSRHSGCHWQLRRHRWCSHDECAPRHRHSQSSHRRHCWFCHCHVDCGARASPSSACCSTRGRPGSHTCSEAFSSRGACDAGCAAPPAAAPAPAASDGVPLTMSASEWLSGGRARSICPGSGLWGSGTSPSSPPMCTTFVSSASQYLSQ